MNKISDPTGNSLAAWTVDFFIFTGDVNHDRSVNSLDFNALAANFNSSGANLSQGDLNSDGVVNALDFNCVASRYGTTLATPASGLSLDAESLPAQQPKSVFSTHPIDPSKSPAKDLLFEA